MMDRLSQMILDKIFHGVLDQGRGCLLIFDEPKADVSTASPLIPIADMECRLRIPLLLRLWNRLGRWSNLCTPRL